MGSPPPLDDVLAPLVAEHPAARAFYADRPVLVTGGLGFIGSNLARQLLLVGARVTVVDNLSPRYGGNPFNLDGVLDRVRWLRIDQADPRAIDPVVAGFDCIFNLTGQVSHVDSMEDPSTDLHANVTSHISLLEACRKHCPTAKVLFAGTRGQYGRPGPSPVTEETRIAPIDANGINKHAGESYHFLYANTYGLRASSLRLTNTYGPRHTMRTSRQGVFAWFVRRALDGQDIQLYGGGDQLRDFNHVTDVAAAFLLAGCSPEADGQVFNLGSPEPASLALAAERIVAAAGRGRCVHTPYPDHLKAIEIGDYTGDYSKIRRVLGWQPRIRLDEGIAQTVRFYREFREHYWQPEPAASAST